MQRLEGRFWTIMASNVPAQGINAKATPFSTIDDGCLDAFYVDGAITRPGFVMCSLVFLLRVAVFLPR
jgi:hypothetical protein